MDHYSKSGCIVFLSKNKNSNKNNIDYGIYGNQR